MKLKLLTGILIFILSCNPVPPYQQAQNPSVGPTNDATNLNSVTTTTEEERNRERDELLAQQTERCRDESKSHECRKDCKTMYKRSEDKEDCERLSPDVIEELLAVHDALEGAETEQVNVEDFKNYLKVSTNGLERVIEEYRQRNAKKFLEWVTDDEDITDIVAGYDDNFRILNLLLRKATGSFNTSDPHRPFIKKTFLDSRTLFELAIYNGNEIALDWFLDFIFVKKGGCETSDDDGRRANCFKEICKIGNSFSNEGSGKTTKRSNWLTYSGYFESYIIDIIDDSIFGVASGTNNNLGGNPPTCWTKGTNTGAGEINDIDDLGDPERDFFKELCQTKTDASCL